MSLCLCGLYGFSRAQEPQPERELTDLPTGKLYLPAHLTPRDGTVDLLIHFHGGYRIVPDAVDDQRINSAVVMVGLNGFSSVYRKPFEDRQRFALLLDEIETAVQANTQTGAEIKLGRVVIVSFSAGYGAVREIVKTPEYVERIDGILLTDSMYASYADPPEAKRAEPAHVSPYVAFARRAIAGEKAFVITHTYLPPGGYAGTHEAAAELLHQLNLERTPVADDVENEPAPNDLRMKERTDAGNLHVFGYHGDTGEDHGDHLRATAGWLPMLPLEFLPAED